MRHHLTENGPKPCNAKTRTCPLGGTHFDSLEEAEVVFAERFEASGLASLNSNREGKESAETSRQYAHWSILNDHLHNSGKTGHPQEMLYYSTPQGALELKRRLNSRYNKSYVEIAEKLQAGPVAFSYDLDATAVEALAAEGKESLLAESSVLKNDLLELPRHINPLRHHLAEESAKWLKRLTPEQQEAVSWHTSNGFAVAQYAIGVEVEYEDTVFLGFVDEPEIDYSYLEEEDWDFNAEDEEEKYEAAKTKLKHDRLAFSKAHLEAVNSALKVAPKLSEPVIITRGTSLAELTDILGETGNEDSASLMDSIEAGELNGRTVSEASRLKQIPLSASAHPRIAAGFAGGARGRGLNFNEKRSVILAIKGRSFASPVNVSAWGTAEYEVLTNPNSRYQVAGGSRAGDDTFILELEELE